MAARKLSEIIHGTPATGDFLVGVTAANADKLFPVSSIGPTPVAADVVFYVSTTGSDSNDGLTPGTAFATIQHAILQGQNFDYKTLFNLIINVSLGTYTITQGVILATTLLNGQNGHINCNGATIKQTQNDTVFVAKSPGLTTWTIDSVIADSPNNCFTVENFCSLVLTGSVTVQDTSGGHDCAYFQTFHGGSVVVGATLTLGNNDFLNFWGGENVRGSEASLQMRFISVVFPGSSFGPSSVWINKAECGSNDYLQEGVSFTNFGNYAGVKLQTASAGGLISILTDNGQLTDLPGVTSNMNFDSLTFFNNINLDTIPAQMVNGLPVEPDNTQVTQFGISFWKDSASGPRFILYNDGGVLHVRQIGRNINAQTSSYTLALSDQDGRVEMNNAGANTLTVPTNATVAFPIGTEIKITQVGAGATTIAGAVGVTVDAAGVVGGQWKTATLYKRGTNEWVQTGV